MIDVKEKIIPMIPLRGLSLYPGSLLNFDIGREKSIKALEEAMVQDQYIFLSAQKDSEIALPTPDDIYQVGVYCKVKQMLRVQENTIRVLVEGISRASVIEMLQETPYFMAKINIFEEEKSEGIMPEIEALMRRITDNFDIYLNLKSKNLTDVIPELLTIDNPEAFSNIVANNLDIKNSKHQEILERIDLKERLEFINELIYTEINVLNIENDINNKLKIQLNKQQKEIYLREQLKIIQKELGDGFEDQSKEGEKFLLDLLNLKLPDDIYDKVSKEIKRFMKLSPLSPDSNVIRTYVETVLEMPWNKKSEDNFDLKEATAILDEDHYGLDKVKERIIEYLAVIKLSNEIKGPILCLVGPPGVGKTSIAKSIARSVNRKFVRISLGGLRDEAEIRGHRRTYIGALPGRIISGIKGTKTNNPVFLLDEIDKIGMDFKGDPASALLEVLDPEQNKAFVDHYLEVPFDLSKVMFITTANTTDTIPSHLKDRMEIIHINGYTEDEKVNIARKYLIPKTIQSHGLKDKDIAISDLAIRDIINYYTRESGVRNLEKNIAKLCRKVAKKHAMGKTIATRINENKLSKYLDKKIFSYDIIEGKNDIGIATGLAWTVVGGVTLFIETSITNGKGQIFLTGQLGDVMKESAKIALTYIRSLADDLNLPEDFFKSKDIHIHIPEGATPKDGPSAGITMCVSMLSMICNHSIRKDVAMTGEITLRGKILPVGGIKEKVLAAYRAGIRKVIIPFENAKDIDDIPENVRNKIAFITVESLEEALPHIFINAKKIKDLKL